MSEKQTETKQPATTERPPERQPGTREHLGDAEFPYQGAPAEEEAKESGSKRSSSSSK